MSTLILADGTGHVIRRIDLHGRERLTIGRSTQRDLIINDPAISRFHCMLYFEAGTWCIADAGSRRGTRIDGHAIVWKRLVPGRIANVGHILMWIEEPTEGEASGAGFDRITVSGAGEDPAEPADQDQPTGCSTLGQAGHNGSSTTRTSAFLTAETDFLVPADRIPGAGR